MIRNIRTACFYARKDITKDMRIFLFISIAIAFATANIIIVNGFMDGWRDDLVEGVVESFSGHLNLYPDEGDRFIEGAGIKEKQLAAMEEVTAYSSRLFTSATMLHEEHSKDVKIIAFDPARDGSVSNIMEKLDSGSALTPGDTRDILISFHLANDLEITTGGRATLAFENGRTEQYTVRGILHTGSPEFDFNSVIMNIHEADRLMDTQGKASVIMVNLEDRDLALAQKQVIAQELGVRTVRSWDQEVEDIVSAMNTWKEMSNTIISVGLIAAAISVGVILYVDIQYKKRQIGIMKAIGTRNSVIFTIFMLEALMLGIVGIFGGSIMGYLGVKYLETHPYYCPIFKDYFGARFYPYLFYQAVTIIILILGMAGLYPSLKASRLNIVRSIWGGE